MSTKKYIERLHTFYGKKGLLVDNFHCQHSKVCGQNAKCGLYRGAEAHVGSRYGENLRVAVVSLDTGGDNPNMDSRRRQIEVEHTLEGSNPHMKGTTQLLTAIYGDCENFHEPFKLFAMTNAAKCSRTDKSDSSKVPWPLYKKCMEYVEPELECLSPELIVTQGNEAYWALRDLIVPQGKNEDYWNQKSTDALSGTHCQILDSWMAEMQPALVRDWLKALANEYLRIVRIGGNDVPMIKSIHPSARAGQWQRFTRIALQPVVAMAKHLAATASKNRILPGIRTEDAAGLANHEGRISP